jgi:GNAT superfamily N-acetyltransferase
MVFEPLYLNGHQNSPPARQETGTGKRAAYQYDHDYRESARLPNGLEVIFRTVHPEEKHMLVEGMERLSQTSRHARFLVDNTSLAKTELRYLTELDGHNHFAIGVVRPLPGGREEGIGIARFVRLKEDPEVAEPAVTVIDEYQGRGVGTALLRRIVDAAHEHGIKKFRCDFLADNQRARSIIDDLDDGAIVYRKRSVVTLEFRLPSPQPDEHPRVTLKGSAIYRAFARVAQGLLSLRRMHHGKKPPDLTSSGGKATVALLEPIQASEQGSLGEARERPSPRYTEEADK